MKWLFVLMAVIVGARVESLRASDPGDSVVLVYNTRLPESRAIAEYYAKRRQVPTNQIFGFALSTNEEISRVEFRDGLQRPLAKAIEATKLWHIVPHTLPVVSNRSAQVEWRPAESRIRYAVLCYGVPLKIAGDPSIKEEGMENLRPEMRRNDAAVDSELALLPMIEDRPPLTGPLRNRVYATTNTALLNPTNGILMVARLDGPSPEIARGLVDKAIQGEADGLWGRAYIDLRNTTEPGYKMGDDSIRNAGEICRRLGFETVVDENPDTFPAGFPMSHIAVYIGWYSQDVSGPFALPTVEFMPGAFAYHLHSFSAVTLRSTTRGWTGPLLAKGAAVSMGCVYEPYLTGTPEMPVFVSRFLYSGFTFGEAAYASQPVLSWQTTVVGDPLYQPFGQHLDVLKDSLLWRQSKLADWYYLRLLNISLANGKPLSECVGTLEAFEPTKRSAVLTEKLGDLYAAQGKPSSAVHAWTEALKLDPTPQQRLRLLLTLGNRLAALDRDAEAYDDFKRLIEDFPAYPDRVSVYRQLVALATKLNKKSDADKFGADLKAESQPPEKAPKQ